MKKLTITERFSILALNAQSSRNQTAAKRAALRCMSAEVVLDSYLDVFLGKEGENLVLTISGIEEQEMSLYQELVLKMIMGKEEEKSASLRDWLKAASAIPAAGKKKMERMIVDSLMGEHLIGEVPDLLGCDINYVTAGITLKEYRSNAEAYTC